jgi:hypothetical protein
MANDTEILKLGENHRRVVSVVLRSLEQMCGEIDGWLERKSGVLFRIHGDLTKDQRAALRALTPRLRGELRRLQGEIELEAAVQSLRGTMVALLSANIVNVEDTDASYLAGYGRLPEEVSRKLDHEFKRLLAILEEAVHLFEKR